MRLARFLAWGWGLLGATASFAVDSHYHQHFRFQGIKSPERQIFGNDSGPDVALYEGKGAWDAGVEHMKLFLTQYQYSYETIKAQDVLDGKLKASRYQMLMMPGGESWEYLKELGAEGGESILEFVRRGGSYFGVCAGAFYATSHRDGGYTTGPYGIGLLRGTAYDGTAYQTPPFLEGMMLFNVLPDFLTRGITSSLKIVMFGGPSFRFDLVEHAQKNLRVLARFDQFNEPAMIAFRYGLGRVFLSGPHLEIEEDRTTWGEEFKDPDSEWPLMHNVTRWQIVK